MSVVANRMVWNVLLVWQALVAVSRIYNLNHFPHQCALAWMIGKFHIMSIGSSSKAPQGLLIVRFSLRSGGCQGVLPLQSPLDEVALPSKAVSLRFVPPRRGLRHILLPR